MSIRVKELVGAEVALDRRNPSATLLYVAWGSDVVTDLVAAVRLAVPAFYKGLAFLNADPKEQQGAGVWLVSARYGLLDAQPGGNPTLPPGPPPPPPPTEDTPIGTTYAFQWGIQGARFTQSKETVDTDAVARVTAPDFKRAINVQPDGGIEGVDLPSWPEAISLTAAVESFTLKYYKSLRALCGKTNNATFLSRTTGHLLYLGGSAQPREGGGFTVTHRFADADDELLDADAVADGLPSTGTFDVPPFHYLWVWYTAKIVDGRTVQAPTALYVERLYDAGDFSALGLFP